jgi:hypothetical protein
MNPKSGLSWLRFHVYELRIFIIITNWIIKVALSFKIVISINSEFNSFMSYSKNLINYKIQDEQFFKFLENYTQENNSALSSF